MTSLIERLCYGKTFDVDGAYVLANWLKHRLIIVATVYVILVFGGKSYMKNRPAYGLRRPLAIWSTMLAVFSLLGASVLVSELVGRLLTDGWQYSICNPSHYVGSSGFWTAAFCLSKLVELGDTAFIVLRKQPLMFLHWYHHITVMLYSTYTWAEQGASGRWYMAINYTVHSIMYTYYAARAWGFRFPKAVNMSIITLQIAQMIAGLIIQLSVFAVKYSGGECQQSYTNFAFGLAMYFSYFVLFLQFFYQAYAKPAKTSMSHQNGHSTDLKTTKTP